MIRPPKVKFQRPIIGDGKRRGMMLVLSSPSGAGKTTISRKLLQLDGSMSLSISVTTRPRRANESDGIDYHFMDKETFERMVQREELLEWAQVFDNYYGTPAGPVRDSLAQGRDVLFDVDWQGHLQLVANAREDLVSIFILPPSYQELARRLKARAMDSDEVIQRRMAKAPEEISHWKDYDYVLVNEDVDETLATVQGIIEVERLKRKRQVGLADFIRKLEAGLDA
ncbi:guanylate kinase [Arenibaculum pallidiluteum]|uniref:guanylate kinase n=1 Tax=Arenibaculum pallidiluteum TaxID=2812559 RepID=UPI001A9710DD|nr:guanylate kinase [Arenibaculum pallidiluteum]